MGTGTCIKKGVNGLEKWTEQGYQLALRAEIVMRVHSEKKSNQHDMQGNLPDFSSLDFRQDSSRGVEILEGGLVSGDSDWKGVQDVPEFCIFFVQNLEHEDLFKQRLSRV